MNKQMYIINNILLFSCSPSTIKKINANVADIIKILISDKIDRQTDCFERAKKLRTHNRRQSTLPKKLSASVLKISSSKNSIATQEVTTLLITHGNLQSFPFKSFYVYLIYNSCQVS